jgi:hypothetical protein
MNITIPQQDWGCQARLTYCFVRALSVVLFRRFQPKAKAAKVYFKEVWWPFYRDAVVPRAIAFLLWIYQMLVIFAIFCCQKLNAWLDAQLGQGLDSDPVPPEDESQDALRTICHEQSISNPVDALIAIDQQIQEENHEKFNVRFIQSSRIGHQNGENCHPDHLWIYPGDLALVQAGSVWSLRNRDHKKSPAIASFPNLFAPLVRWPAASSGGAKANYPKAKGRMPRSRREVSTQ